MNPAEPNSQPPETVIRVEGLTKMFGRKTVVDDFSMVVRKGEIYGFLGPNGSGKTTTIRMLCGLLSPDGGRGTCLDLDIVKDREAIKPQVGYMAQHFSLYEDLTVWENLDFTARVYGLKGRKKVVEDTITRLNLTPFGNQLAGTLSGGWKQRLALGSCLIHKPKLLMLDEPTAGVDPQARREFWDQIHSLTREGITVLISTHYMDEAEKCNRLAYIAYGRLLTTGTVEEVMAGENLTTYKVTGPGLSDLAGRLKGVRGIDQVVPVGNALHVSGRDRKLLSEAISPFRRDSTDWTPVEPSLEEIFISLMDRHRSGLE